MSNIKKVELLSGTKFLSLYNAIYDNKKGNEKQWTIASRKNLETLEGQLIENKEDKVDAVVIVAIHEEENKLVLVKQFRVPINGYIYELPAGLVDNNEDPTESIKRELKEETGLELVKTVKDLGRKKVYLSPGMTDESVDLVYCTCKGVLSKEHLEEDEDLEPILVSKEDAIKILNSNEKIDIKCLLILQWFINGESKDI